MSGKKVKNVLLIDDDNINNYINERLIQKMGFTEDVKVVTNGFEGIKYLESIDASSFPKLIFLDINMPVMDGFEFIEAFKKINREEKVVIIMLTTSTNDKDIERVQSIREVASYLNKPLTQQKIEEVVGRFFPAV